MSVLYRPLVQSGPVRPESALTLAGGWCWFTHVERIAPGTREVIEARDMPGEARRRLTAPRAPLGQLTLDRPRIMAILNTTPDSFSDGGLHDGEQKAAEGAHALIEAGADILDIGGESTRPGASPVALEEETARTEPVIAALAARWPGLISIDTRNAPVALAAARAGAGLLNDVSAMLHDPEMAEVARARALPICLMHSQGDPQTMQADPRYDDVLCEVYAHLEERVAAAVAAGIARERIVVDPGIGFGKTLEHNLALLARISVFHGLGCAILLGASRKRFIGTLGGAPDAADRMPGSIAVALACIAQGVQIVRVHDMAATRQAVTLWQSSIDGEAS
ncbi:dihydropteroate synthase [Profundibacterium mesophilum]|uniref:Dihydropteroate synthase n=1 Tax=Profundibacterium mesophilum KAUST100406-0324 TaxID=1037889 RepID=A0A921P1C7_9RHOB|nr:dihydropteroate synthase [Profundibacterium mesophilum]KAF0677393.1 dihydropteroate synthase [Profundibacterium mesophilum KAUST100406-0324]